MLVVPTTPTVRTVTAMISVLRGVVRIAGVARVSSCCAMLILHCGSVLVYVRVFLRHLAPPRQLYPIRVSTNTGRREKFPRLAVL
ncbi:hypothetical protein [Phytoactinopolyspora halotolerans]|uniref:hypothetical protein n=1 Tax=Phytoactinopolyspora halotolerans TaxID=1981512 RepID=UPI001C209145|nr:hypothetical protein [Phytoactinopolyspora halotolerans]